ncbi:hypothetical protein E2C01_101867 [Portunus trituberculatus]|uniref:Uncharacterized protein n=1 Tax=Portunus trituberculatus TaxID=210409 RepID=A0A5B7KGX4_PORTR|nr:hypothetical protein [Portunus trituberculatus]
MAISEKILYTCTYCKREGHITTKCFVRRRDLRKVEKENTSVSGGASQLPHQRETGAVRRPIRTGNASASNTASSSSRNTSGRKLQPIPLMSDTVLPNLRIVSTVEQVDHLRGKLCALPDKGRDRKKCDPNKQCCRTAR